MRNNTTTLQLYACVTATKDLIHKGMHNPRIEEITKGARGLWPIGSSEIEWTIKHISQIKDILVNEEELTVILINKKLYSIYHQREPSTVELAKDVLASKGKHRPAGLHLVTAEDDTIWLAAQERLEGVGLGVIRKFRNEIDKAVKENRLTSGNGQKIVKELKSKI